MRVTQSRLGIGMIKPTLPCSHRNVLAVHDGFIAVTEGVEAASPDPQFFRAVDRVRFRTMSASHGVPFFDAKRSPSLFGRHALKYPRRCSTSCGEISQARTPFFRLHDFDLSMPNLLSDLDRAQIEQKVPRWQATRFSATDWGWQRTQGMAQCGKPCSRARD
jgi:hypothetical protein